MHFVNKQCIFTTIGVCLVSIGLLLAIFWMEIFHAILATELALKPGSKSYRMWKKPPLTLNFDIYLYNWTNPTNLTEDHYEKPILEQIGPYRFREIGMKTKVYWHPKNSTISYRKRNTYYFDAEGSVGRLDDKITSLNVVAFSAANTARNWGFMVQKQVSMALKVYNQPVFITKSASELLFDGYQDDMIDIGRLMHKFGPYSLNIPYDRFGWFYGRNESEEVSGHFNIKTGVDDIMELGIAKTFNYKSETGFYNKKCDQVRGSAGEFYPPGQTKDKPLTFYNGELCRYLDLFYTDELNVNGLTAYKYSATERSVDNGTKYSEYLCFAKGESVASGLMNVSACRYGAPVFISFPHFYAADPTYLNYVDGMKPSKNEHEFYIALDPITGVPIDVAARLQVNIHIRRYPNIELYQEAPELFFPVLWFEQKVRIPNEMIEDIRIAVSMPKIGYICTAIIAGIGIIFLIWVYCQRRQQLHTTTTTTTTTDPDLLPCEKNEIECEKRIEPEHSPLMKTKKMMTDFEIMHSPSKPKALRAPLPIAANEVESIIIPDKIDTTKI